MLSDPSVQRISTTPEMSEWWNNEVQRVKSRTVEHAPIKESETTGLGGEGERSGDQWAGKMPGHRGT